MNRLKFGVGVLRPLLLGMLAGGLATGLCLSQMKQREARQRVARQQEAARQRAKQRNWLRDPLGDAPFRWSYMKVDEEGWSAEPLDNLSQLKERINTSDEEIVIPVFPTVYAPNNYDDLYYDALLESDIQPGDKVLVIGTGSGSDAWVAWLKSQSPIYVVEVNPMAVANAKATARIGGFDLKPILGDIRDVELPEEFSDFDYVLWNMPFLAESGKIEQDRFHDGDDGSILRKFLALLPSLLKKDGKALIFNYAHAEDFIDVPHSIVKREARRDGKVIVCVIPNSAG